MPDVAAVTLSLREGGVGVIELNRPEEGNSFTLAMLRELSAAIDSASDDPGVRALVITGAGRHFSVGASPDLLEYLQRSAPLQVQESVYSLAQGVARRMYGCSKPTVAAVSGAAVTLGCEYALQCDFRLIDETAIFHEAWIHVGLLPPLGGMVLLPQLVGLTRACEMILQGRRIAAQEAAAIGLANQVVPKDELIPRACSLAAELGALPRHAYQLAKQGLHRGLHSTMEAELAAASMAQSLLMSTEEFGTSVDSIRRRHRKPPPARPSPQLSGGPAGSCP